MRGFGRLRCGFVSLRPGRFGRERRHAEQGGGNLDGDRFAGVEQPAFVVVADQLEVRQRGDLRIDLGVRRFDLTSEIP